jgi:valyl-tRNA synthetase
VPETLLEQHGADVVRYWAASSKLGADTAYSEDTVKNGKRRVTKLWNAAKFVAQHFDKIPEADKELDIKDWVPASAGMTSISCDFDKYFLSRLSELVSDVSSEFEQYEYAGAMHKIEQFFWSVFCDNYLEITKTRAYDEEGANESGALSARLTLYHSLKVLLKLFAPFMPHITEEIYQILYADSDSIHARHSWPALDISFEGFSRKESENLISVLELVRKIKAQDNLSIKAPISCIEVEQGDMSESLVSDLKHVTSAEEVKLVQKITSDKQALSVENLKINVVY